MNFKEYLQETQEDMTIRLSAPGLADSALARSFSKSESDLTKKNLSKNAQSKGKLKSFLKSINDETEKYSDAVVVECGTLKFSLYAANGQLRLGAGGGLTKESTLLKEFNINDFLDKLSTARVR